jgi:hypothetical protein
LSNNKIIKYQEENLPQKDRLRNETAWNGLNESGMLPKGQFDFRNSETGRVPMEDWLPMLLSKDVEEK